MSWTLRIRVLGADPPKTFNIADDDQRLVTLYQAGRPQEYATTVEKVGEQIWKKVLEDGAYIDVMEGRGIVIPVDKILEIEVGSG
ncbi:MAG: hypothetical protein ACLQPD_29535 [Desulfomonilaceae bacterium]